MKKNLLFIVIDTLRADKCFGNHRTVKTPNIDKLISNGTYFEQATSSVHGTVSSLGTIFSGSHSFKTGLGGEKYSEIYFEGDSCFDFFKKNGYHQYAIVPKIVSHLGILKNIENSDFTYPAELRLHEGLGDRIIKKIQSNAMKTPWFTYIHLNDLHAPVICPEKFNNKNYGTNQYERMFSHVDFWIGKILSFINTKDTLVLITADHGQNSVTANYEPSHIRKIYWKTDKKIPKKLQPIKNKIIDKIRAQKFKKTQENEIPEFDKRLKEDSRINEKLDVFDDVLRVPLILHNENIPKNLVISDQVNHIDIIPTIEDILELKIKMENVDGLSLMPLLKNEKMDERPIFIESHPTRKETEYHLVGIRTSTWKYFRDLRNPKKQIHLYQLKKDPLEKNNIFKQNDKIVNELEKILDGFLKIRNKLDSDQTEQSQINQNEIDEVEKELRKQGYL